MFSDFLIEDF